MIRGGRNYVSSSPAFSNDAKRLLVCAGNSVAVFSTATGLQVSSLDAHTAPVTAVIVVPASTPGSKILCFCWTTSLDGTIRYWDFAAPELIRTLDIKLPVYSMVIPSMVSQSAVSNEKTAKVFAYISVEAKTKSDNGLCGQVRKFNLTDSCMVGGAILAEMKKPEVLTISPSGDLFGVRRKRKLQIWKVPSADSDRTVLKKITLHHTKTISAIAFHPTQRIVAAGDVSGRILTWRGFGDKTFAMSAGHVNGSAMDTDEENPGVRVSDDADTCTTWHWHPGQVNLLSFSSDGAYLLSGGKEGVLVVWQVDTGKKKFLPRIGSPLLHLVDSPDPSLSSISCADNQIHLVKRPSMEILKSISGIKLPCSHLETSMGISNGISFDHNAGLVALRTENYSVQLYSLFDDRGISEVQVYERNHQPVDEVTIIVTSVVLSPDGSMMCTSEVRLPEDGLGNLICLKFWDSKSETGDFSLSTIVYEPHRDAKISDIAFNPKHRMAVSSSFGGDFKVWSSNSGVPEKEQIQPNSGWVCHSAGSYKKKSMTAAAFSPDGSVLAVAAETVITLWDPAKNLLVAVIGEVPMPIASLSFIGNSDHLVSTSLSSKPQLSVWSLSSLSICWSYGLHIEAIASSSDASSFAALVLLPQSVRADDSKDKANNSVGGLILLFNSAEPKPLAVWSVKKAKCGTLAFIKNKNQSCEQEQQEAQTLLAYMNGDHEYLLFNPYLKEGSEVSIAQWKGHQNSLEEAGKSRINLISDGVRFAGNLTSCFRSGKLGYESLYGELPPESKPAGKQIAWIPSAPTDERAWEKIFSSSSHNLPPLTKLCASFLESLLEKRSSVQE
ncbi:WD repeat-containing protein 75 [Linum grandiflorum]